MSANFAPNCLTFLADAAISKGMAVKLGSDREHVLKGAANTNKCIGIALNATTAAEDAVEVALPGAGAKGLLGETVSAGDSLVCHTDGTLVKPNTIGDILIAVAMEDGVAGDIIGVHVIRGHAAVADQ